MSTFPFDNIIWVQINSKRTFKSRKRNLSSRRPRMSPFNNITVSRVWNNAPLSSTYQEYAHCGMIDKKVTNREEERNQPALMGTELQQPWPCLRMWFLSLLSSSGDHNPFLCFGFPFSNGWYPILLSLTEFHFNGRLGFSRKRKHSRLRKEGITFGWGNSAQTDLYIKIQENSRACAFFFPLLVHNRRWNNKINVINQESSIELKNSVLPQRVENLFHLTEIHLYRLKGCQFGKCWNLWYHHCLLSTLTLDHWRILRRESKVICPKSPKVTWFFFGTILMASLILHSNCIF